MPYCADARHSDDTFFLICEEDFRLTRNDAQAMPATMLAEAKRIVREAGQEVVSNKPFSDELEDEDILINPNDIFRMREEDGATADDAQYTFADGSEMTDDWKNSFGKFFTKKVSRGVGEHVPEVLKDLVKISIAANRENVGHFIWYSWEGSDRPGARSRPMHGATMIGISTFGARKLLSLMSSGLLPKGHADLVLREYMENNGKDFGASFLYPSVGHYQSHQSGCEKGLGWRQNDWQKGWIMEGTRKASGVIATHPMKNEHRYLVHFRRSGQPEWIRQVTLPEPDDEELKWLSFDDSEPLDAGEDAPMTSPRDVEEASSSAGAPMLTRRQKRQRRLNAFKRGFRNWTAVLAEA